jgi:hypothetical protein
VHKEVPVWLVVKLWGSISCAGALPIAQHTRARKHQHHHDFFKKVLLAKLKVVWRRGVFLWAKQATIFIGKER